MQISREALFSLMTTGYVTLQVPQFNISFGRNGGVLEDGQIPRSPEDTMDIPNDYLYELKHCGMKSRPTIGKESGFTYITRKGYEALKPQIKEAFLSAFHAGRARVPETVETEEEAWSVFEQYAETHFSEVEECIAKQLKQYQAKVSELISLVP